LIEPLYNLGFPKKLTKFNFAIFFNSKSILQNFILVMNVCLWF